MQALLYEEPTLLDTIVAFLPVANASKDGNHRLRPLTDYLETLAALCRVFPSLGERISPHNHEFWRVRILSHFDFTTRCGEDDLFYVIGHNVHISYDMIRSITPMIGFPPPEDRPWILRAMYDFESSHGHSRTSMLGEFPEWWPSIGAFFRSTEYGFLHRIQSGRATMDSWPEHEDAYTLYRDLVLLKERLAKFDTLEAHGSEGFTPSPILMRRMNKDITGYGYAMLMHCHISPFFWTGRPPVSSKWSGLDRPLPADSSDTEHLARTQEEDEIFSLTPGDPQTFQALRRLVHESFDD